MNDAARQANADDLILRCAPSPESTRGVFAVRDNFGGTKSYFLRAASGAVIGEFKVWEHAANAMFHQMLHDLLEHEDPLPQVRAEPAHRVERVERVEREQMTRTDHTLETRTVRVNPLVRTTVRQI